MNRRLFSMLITALLLTFLCSGCKEVPGRPGAPTERPDQLLQFSTLYAQNCAACHGENGKHGASISLANPVYLSLAGVEKIEQITAHGVSGTLMPPFAKSQGGMLTDQQIQVIAQGLISNWSNAGALSGQTLPAYASSSAADQVKGQQAFTTFCASCHGADGTGVSHGNLHTGSLVEPAYLALISDQGLRSLIIAGMPEQGMPDWRSDMIGAGSRAMTDQEITDTVAWLTSHRTTTPGQFYMHQ